MSLAMPCFNLFYFQYTSTVKLINVEKFIAPPPTFTFVTPQTSEAKQSCKVNFIFIIVNKNSIQQKSLTLIIKPIRGLLSFIILLKALSKGGWSCITAIPSVVQHVCQPTPLAPKMWVGVILSFSLQQHLYEALVKRYLPLDAIGVVRLSLVFSAVISILYFLQVLSRLSSRTSSSCFSLPSLM